MTSDRSRAYGRVVSTIEEIGATKLQEPEVSRIRDAADTLLFCEDLSAPGAREALEDALELARHLADSGRWTDERAQRLAEDIAGCGPVAHVA